MEERILIGKEVWEEISRCNAVRSGPATIVVSYLGKGGSDLLPLRSGDSLFVGATSQNVAAGLVDPSELLKYPAGVQIFRVRSLHAKFYCFDDKIIIGSANVSQSSRDRLIEAAVVLSACTQRIKDILEKIESEPLTIEDIESLRQYYQNPQGAIQEIVGVEGTSVTPQEPQLSINEDARVWYHGTFPSFESVSGNPWTSGLLSLSRVKRGDWYISVYEEGGKRWAIPPRLVNEVKRRENRVRLKFESETSAELARSAADLEILAEPTGSPVKHRQLLLSRRIPAQKIFKFFGIRVSVRSGTSSSTGAKPVANQALRSRRR